MDKDKRIDKIFSNAIFNQASRVGKSGHYLFIIPRPHDRTNPMIIRRLFESRCGNPLYWIDCMPGRPAITESEVQDKITENIVEGVLWKRMK